MEIEDKKDLILEGNKLLAVYLGYKYFPFNSKERDLECGWFLKDISDVSRRKDSKLLFYSTYLGRTHKHLRFFNDWNLLMRVWKKYLDSKIKIQDTNYNLYDSVENAERNLMEANREQFFYSLVDVVQYLNKNGEAS